MANNTSIKVYVDISEALPPLFLITDALFRDVLSKYPNLEQRFDYQIGKGEDSFLQGVKDADVLVVWDFPTGNLHKNASRLQWIQLIGAGLDHLLPLDWLPSGITLTTGSGSHRPKADEFMMLSLLMLNNRIPEIVDNQQKRVHKVTYSSVITGKTVLLVGLGATGTAAAQSARKLGLKVIGIRHSKAPHPDVDEVYGPQELRSLLPQADFVIMTVPKTRHTIGLMGRNELQSMKRGAGLINLSRHEIIDEDALADLLTDGHLTGAIYDLEDPEQVPSNPRLWSTDKIIIAPHCLTNDPETFMVNGLSLFFENLERYLSNKPLHNQVNPESQY